jgi:hypothetical protein
MQSWRSDWDSFFFGRRHAFGLSTKRHVKQEQQPNIDPAWLRQPA